MFALPCQRRDNTVMDEPPRRSRELLDRAKSRLLVIDLQEKFLPVIPNMGDLLTRCRLLMQTAGLLGVPMNVTEQYPRGLGATIPQIRELLAADAEIPSKLRFSAAQCCDWMTKSSDERFQIVVAGIETHVCIQQTVLDLLAEGFAVYLVVDAIGSRKAIDHAVALERMRLAGAVLTTAESVVFEWCEVAGTPEFKTVSGWVKNVP